MEEEETELKTAALKELPDPVSGAAGAGSPEESGSGAADAAAERRRVRRRTSSVCYGIVLYLFMFTVLQVILYFEYSLAADVLGGILPEEPSDFFYGVMILISTVAALCLSWLFFAGQAERRVLFRQPSLAGEIFQRRERMPLVRFLQYIGLIFLMQMLFSYITGLFELLFNHFGYTLQYSEAMNADYAGSWTLLTYAVLLGPLAEEIVYRGFLMRGLEPCGRRYALIVCSVVFGLMHGDFQQSMFTVFAGLLFGYAAMRYSVWYSLALHIFNNGILGELWIWFIDRAPDTVYITLILIFLVLSAIGTVQLIRKRGRDAVLWLKEEQTRPGAWPALVNLWMILFLAYSVTEIVLSIRPLT